MKIAEVAAFVLSNEANSAENYPNVYSSYSVRQALDIIDEFKSRMADKFYDEDAYATFGDDFILTKDFAISEICEEIETFYNKGAVPSIDIFLEEYE